MRGGNCGKGDEGRGLWEKGRGERTVGKAMRGPDCWKRYQGRGLWEKG